MPSSIAVSTRSGPASTHAVRMAMRNPAHTRLFRCGRRMSPRSLRLRLRRKPARVPVTSSTSSTATPRHESCSCWPSVRVGSMSARPSISSSTRSCSISPSCSSSAGKMGSKPVARDFHLVDEVLEVLELFGLLGEDRLVALVGEQLGVGPDRRDRAVPQQGRPVGERDGRRPVDHDERGHAVEHAAQRRLDQLLGVDVERGERVVEHDDLWPRQDRPGQRDALPLPARQRHALLADPGVEPPRQVVHELRLRHEQRVVDLLVRRVGVAERDVLADARGEERGLFEADRDLAAQRPQRRVADVDTVDRHPAVRDVVEARHEHRQRRLARAGEADERDRLTRLDLEVDVAEDPLAVAGVPEVDGLEPHLPGDVPELTRLGGILHARIAVEHLEHALGRGRRLFGHPEDPAERLDGPDDHQEVAHERDQAAERHRPAADRERADEQHRRERDAGQHVQDPFEVDDEPDALHRRVVQDAGLPVEAGVDVGATAERLDGTDAGGAFLHLRGEVAGVVLHRARRLRIAPLEDPEDEHQRHGHHHDHERQERVEPRQQHEHDERGDPVDHEEDRAPADEATDGADVARGAARGAAPSPSRRGSRRRVVAAARRGRCGARSPRRAPRPRARCGGRRQHRPRRSRTGARDRPARRCLGGRRRRAGRRSRLSSPAGWRRPRRARPAPPRPRSRARTGTDAGTAERDEDFGTARIPPANGQPTLRRGHPSSAGISP